MSSIYFCISDSRLSICCLGHTGLPTVFDNFSANNVIDASTVSQPGIVGYNRQSKVVQSHKEESVSSHAYFHQLKKASTTTRTLVLLSFPKRPIIIERWDA